MARAISVIIVLTILAVVGVLYVTPLPQYLLYQAYHMRTTVPRNKLVHVASKGNVTTSSENARMQPEKGYLMVTEVESKGTTTQAKEHTDASTQPPEHTGAPEQPPEEMDTDPEQTPVANVATTKVKYLEVTTQTKPDEPPEPLTTSGDMTITTVQGVDQPRLMTLREPTEPPLSSTESLEQMEDVVKGALALAEEAEAEWDEPGVEEPIKTQVMENNQVALNQETAFDTSRQSDDVLGMSQSPDANKLYDRNNYLKPGIVPHGEHMEDQGSMDAGYHVQEHASLRVQIPGHIPDHTYYKQNNNMNTPYNTALKVNPITKQELSQQGIPVVPVAVRESSNYPRTFDITDDSTLEAQKEDYVQKIESSLAEQLFIEDRHAQKNTENNQVNDNIEPILSKNILDTKEQLQNMAANANVANQPGIEPIKCENLRKPITALPNSTIIELKPRYPDDWQTIIENVSLVFSAHRDPRHFHVIRIHVFGIMLTRVLQDPIKRRLYCQLWTPDKLQVVVAGNTRVMTLRNEYESFMLECDFPLDTNLSRLSHFLAITPYPCTRSINAMQIHSNNYITEPLYKFTVCMCGSLKSGFSDYRRFIEWMELNAILGAEKTQVYVTDISPMMMKILRYYGQKGMLDRIRWAPPVPEAGKVSSTHRALANDCLYRNMKKTKYLVMLDVDETLAPRKQHTNTWQDMIRSANCLNSSYISALNTYFHPEWPDDELYKDNHYIAEKLKLLTVLKTKRDNSFWPFEVRSKNIIKPEAVDYVKLHKVFFMPGVKEEPCVLPESDGALYHYRAFTRNNTQDKQPWVLDRSLQKYGALLTRTVSLVYKELVDTGIL